MPRNLTIDVSEVEAARIGVRQAAGTPLDLVLTFHVAGYPMPDLAAFFPQLVVRPRTKRTAYGYDIDVFDPVQAIGRVTLPGSAIQDDAILEVYTRNLEGQPIQMLAHGNLYITGEAYEIHGPLGPMTFPTLVGPVGPQGIVGPQGPEGPQGEQGMQGVRGGTWFTGVGDPVAPGTVDGDMYLDTATGNVWRWAEGTWSRFAGT